MSKMVNRKILIREAEAGDAEDIAKMMARLKKLNEEFETQFKVVDELDKKALDYTNKVIKSEKSIITVAEINGKVGGFIKADIVDRIFYQPKSELRITDFYIMPEFRRNGLGKKILTDLTDRASKNGIKMITAEFPALNLIGLNFYKKSGFRGILNVYGKEIS